MFLRLKHCISRSWGPLNDTILRPGCSLRHTLHRFHLMMLYLLLSSFRSYSCRFFCGTRDFGIFMVEGKKCTHNFGHSFCTRQLAGNISLALKCGLTHSFDIYPLLFHSSLNSFLLCGGTCYFVWYGFPRILHKHRLFVGCIPCNLIL